MYFFTHMMSRTETPADNNTYNIHPFFPWEKALDDPSIMEFLDSYSYEWKPGEVGQDNPQVNKKIRNCDVANIEYSPYTRGLFDALHKPVESINFWHYNYNLWSMDDAQVCKFDKGGMFVMHNDRSALADRSERKLTVLVGLSEADDYKGGDIHLLPTGYPKHKQTVRLNKGDMLVFPTWVPYEIRPIEEGSMKLLTTWVYGPKFI